MSLFLLLAQMFNRAIFGDDDDELPDEIRLKPHLTLGKWDGEVHYIDRIGSLPEVADWINLDNIFIDYQQLANKQQTFGGYMKEMAKAPVKKIINSLNPMIKTPFELATGQRFYPNIFRPTPIRDNGQYLASSLGLGWPYKAITGVPYSDKNEMMNIFSRSVNPDEAAYFQTLDKVRQFQERVLGKSYNNFSTTKRGRVLQMLRTAMRYKDKAAIRRYLREYMKLDGTKNGLQQSMRNMNPLHGLNGTEKKQFIKWLSKEDRKYLRKADRYYHSLTDRFLK